MLGLAEVLSVVFCEIGLIRGSSQTLEGLRALAHSSASSCLISSCAPTVSPPYLQSSRCSTVASFPQPSHLVGRDSGRIPYRMEAMSRHSSRLRHVPLTWLGMVVNHAPVCFLRLMVRSREGGMDEVRDL